MKNSLNKRLFILFLFLPFCVSLFAGCGVKSPAKEGSVQEHASAEENDGREETTGAGGSSDTIVETAPVDFSHTDADMFTDRDRTAEYDADACVRIQLNGSSAAASSDSVRIAGTTITITEEATYLISGALDDGMLVINADAKAKIQIIFENAHIHSETSAPLYILEADKVFVTLAQGTKNSLTAGAAFTAIDDNNIDGAIFSKQDLTFNGSGTLTVTSPAGHGIVCKDDLVMTGGTYEISAASHGLDANDSVRVINASLTIDAGKDGIHAEHDEDAALGFVYLSDGSLNIEAEGDGISAGAYLQINDGTFAILAGGGSENGSQHSSDGWGGFPGGDFGGGNRPGRPSFGSADPAAYTTLDTSQTESSSMKGLKAESGILISGGSFSVNAADDTIHSNASLTISGGSFDLASGDDAIHAEDTLTVTDGKIRIRESYEGLEALHIQVTGGDINLVASDDGLNAAGGTDQSGTTGGRDGMFGGGKPGGGMGGFGGMSGNSDGTITISGGTLYINSSGDGIDANGTLEISGGHTTIVGPTQGDTAVLDYDISGTITGGTFIGTGSSMMAQTLSGTGQGVIGVSVGSQTAGTAITVCDASGTTLLTYAPEMAFQIFIYSSPDIQSDTTYALTVGELAGDVEAQ